MKYRADIDGLRAVAVLSVVFFHAKLGLAGGYVGVDIFFVISGYLITALLLKSLQAGTFSLAQFWERRVRRLLPALTVTILITSAVGYLVLLPDHLHQLGGSIIAQPLCMSNLYFWRVIRDGYFSDSPDIHPLLHTWSLGLEEQFYVLFPCLLLVLFKSQPARLYGWLSTLAFLSLLGLHRPNSIRPPAQLLRASHPRLGTLDGPRCDGNEGFE